MLRSPLLANRQLRSLFVTTRPIMSAQARSSSTAAAGSAAKPRAPPMEPRPSSSVMLLSPTNQLLLLQRVKASSSFASAFVFPGGNISSFHETVPAVGSAERHVDSEAYRLSAIREMFEESGILLARKAGSSSRSELLDVPVDVREEGRKAIHNDKVTFADWLKSVGGEPDVDGLIPFTRWVTPPNVPKRFTTQMYVYMLPLSSEAERDKVMVVHTPTQDGGIEHTEASFDDVSDWLVRASSGEIIIYPPQVYLLTLLGQFLVGPGDYAAQREKLVEFLAATPTGRTDHPTAKISWADKCISPVGMPIRRADGRAILALDKPGPELMGSDRAGDWDRVVLVKGLKHGPTEVEVKWRDDIVAEAEKTKEQAAKL